tara:strand:- start:1141 stop:1314 length:174 start_codon:yes stop_codon:yes gene_type:complete
VIKMPKENKDMKAHKWRREQLPKILAKIPKPKKRGRPRKSKSVESGEENDGKQKDSE